MKGGKAHFLAEAQGWRLSLLSDAGDLQTSNKKRRGLVSQPQFLVPRDTENEKPERKILVREIKPSEGYIF